MALSDCEKCWSTPCECGWNFRNYSADHFSKYIANILQYRRKQDAKIILKRALLEIDKIEDWYMEYKFKCDICGMEKTSIKHPVYDEQFNESPGLSQCDDCIKQIPK